MIHDARHEGRRDRAPAVRRPFAPEEMNAIEALAGCRFTPGSTPKRFVRDMFEVLRRTPCPGITEPQADLLRRLVHTFRRQLPARIVFDLVGIDAVPFELFVPSALAAAELLLPHIRRREKAGVFGVFPSTAWHLIPVVERPLGLTDFHTWAATGLLLNDGRLRPMSDEDLVGRSVILQRYWPDPRPLMTDNPQQPLPITT